MEKNQHKKYVGYAQNPYTGEIINTVKYDISFWAIILGLHTSLLIPVIGEDIVSISTFIFLFLLCTGLYLWFPKKKRFRKSLSIKFGATFNRLNYDLHKVLGFYAFWIAIFVAFTGLVMSYQWVSNSVYLISNGFEIPQRNDKKIIAHNGTDIQLHLLNQSLNKVLTSYKDNIQQYFLVFPKDSLSTYRLTVNTKNGFWINRNDEYRINPSDGKILDERLFSDKSMGTKVLDANINVHTGKILGLSGKFVAFFVSLISASLPITGFYLWWGRKKKKFNYFK